MWGGKKVSNLTWPGNANKLDKSSLIPNSISTGTYLHIIEINTHKEGLLYAPVWLRYTHTYTHQNHTLHQTHTSFMVKEKIHPLSCTPSSGTQAHSMPCFQIGAACAQKEAGLMLRADLADCRHLISTVTHYHLRGKNKKQRPFSFNLACRYMDVH